MVKTQEIRQRKKKLIRGHWRVKIWENEAEYARYLAGEDVKPIQELDQENGITDLGIHYVLDCAIGNNASQITAWYGGLINNSGYTGVANGDTAASHTGWVESQDYTEGTRQAFVFAAASGRAIVDSIAFTINATVTIKGLFVISNSTKGGTTGTLFSTAIFSSPPALVNGNVFTANYSLTD